MLCFPCCVLKSKSLLFKILNLAFKLKFGIMKNKYVETFQLRSSDFSNTPSPFTQTTTNFTPDFIAYLTLFSLNVEKKSRFPQVVFHN